MRMMKNQKNRGKKTKSSSTNLSVVFHIKKYSMMFFMDFQGKKSFRISLKSLPYFSMASSNRLASEADQSSISSRHNIGPNGKKYLN